MILVSVFALLSFSGCGGGSSDSGMLIEGTLTEAGGANEARFMSHLLHSAGERIENVEICALGACSTTDSSGQWGFEVEPMTGEVLFTIQGHGIDETSTATIPTGAEDVVVDLRHVPGGIVTAQVVSVNGKAIESTDDEDHHADDHTHLEGEAHSEHPAE